MSRDCLAAVLITGFSDSLSLSSVSKRSLDLDDVSFLHRVAINMAMALNLASLDKTSDAKKAVRGENFSFHSDDTRLQYQTLGSELWWQNLFLKHSFG